MPVALARDYLRGLRLPLSKLADQNGCHIRQVLFVYMLGCEKQGEQYYVCSYCRPLLNNNKMPSRCILNGLETVPVPPELSNIDPLSCQLIQRAKAFQAIIRLGTYTGKVPAYNSLKACKGTMFFLPLPISNTFETLDAGRGRERQSLPDPELYIILNGKHIKNKVVWQTLVHISKVTKAFQKLTDFTNFSTTIISISIVQLPPNI